MKPSHLITVLIFIVSALLVVGCSSSESRDPDLSLKSSTFEIQPADGINENSMVYAGPSGESQAASERPVTADAGVLSEVPALAQGEVNPQANQQAGESAIDADTAAPEEQEAPAEPIIEGPLPPVDPTIGNLAPDFTLTTLDGQTVTLAELRGHPVMLNYWVTWCIPCRDEMPVIEALQKEYAEEGLVVLSINGTRQEVLADVENLVSEFDLSLPVLLDENENVYNGYRILFMPTSFFIDARGVIQDIVLGSTDESGFRARLESIVAGAN